MVKKIGFFLLFFISLIIIEKSIALADCQGCCSYHGGVVCRNGVTMCADGTPLSTTCQSKGCNVCTTTPPPPTPPPPDDRTIKIASFNVKELTIDKANNQLILNKIALIISNFDVVAIQEVQDDTGYALQTLEDEIDSLGSNYDFILSSSVGRTSYLEQFAFFYRSDKLRLISNELYDDKEYDLFERDPFIVHLASIEGNFDFVLINVHIKPDNATNEIGKLANLLEQVQLKFPEESDFIIIGDLNADCAFFDENDQSSSLKSAEYTWLISNDMDTNVAETECTYDRIIIQSPTLEDYSGNSGVHKFDDIFSLTNDEAIQISDHYPVWSSFYIGRDTDVPTSSNTNSSNSGGGGGGGCFIDSLTFN